MKMKEEIKKLIIFIVAAVALILVIGSAGAYERNNISWIQCLITSGIGFITWIVLIICFASADDFE